MVKSRVFYVLFGCFYIVCIEAFSAQNRNKRDAEHDWGYSLHNGPSTWGGICQTGARQSPINIQLGSVIVKDFPSFSFGKDYFSKHRFYAKNNGHTIYVALEDDSIQPVIYGGGLKDKFIFKQLHLHWESEHEFDGKRANLEMHMVHYNSKHGNFENASTKEDGLAVLAVIFDKSNKTESSIEKFFEFILDAATVGDHPQYPPSPNNLVQDNEEENEEKLDVFALRDLIPKHVSRFFRYEGSLTTPGCGEVVQWTILINRLPVSNKVLEAFRTLRDHDGNALLQNFRPPQKLNGRKVYIQIKNYDDRSTAELEQYMSRGAYPKALLSIPLLYCCLFLLSNYN